MSTQQLYYLQSAKVTETIGIPAVGDHWRPFATLRRVATFCDVLRCFATFCDVCDRICALRLYHMRQCDLAISHSMPMQPSPTFHNINSAHICVYTDVPTFAMVQDHSVAVI